MTDRELAVYVKEQQYLIRRARRSIHSALREQRRRAADPSLSHRADEVRAVKEHAEQDNPAPR